MFSVNYIPVFISILQISQVCLVESKLFGYDEILEIDLNTLKGLLAADKLGDSLKRSSVDSGPAAPSPANTGIQSPVSLPSNTQYSTLPLPLYFRKPNPVKKSPCDKVHGNSQKVHRTPLAATSSTVSSTHYGLSSGSTLLASPSSSVPSVGQKIEMAKNFSSTASRTHADSTAKPAKSNQTSSVPTAKSTEMVASESVSHGASTVLSQAAYAAASPNSHLAVAAPSASGYGAGNMQPIQGASIAQLPGLKPLAIEEHQKAAFHDFTGALENHELKPLTHQDVQNLPVVSHSALTGGPATAPQSQGGYSNQGNNNYGANPNQGYMQQFNGFAGAPGPASYNEGPAMGSFNGGFGGAQSFGGQHYGGANSGPSYGIPFFAPNTQSFGGMPNGGQFHNNVQSGISQSYGYPSGSHENSNNPGWNSPLRAFLR
uniref:Uncharacterized protein n=1 Tax=Tetranychus urticae TaxID=32264 RepID=T1K0R9_TETUR